MATWLSRSQRQAEADAILGLVEDTAASPGTPGATEFLGDDIPDIGDCAVCRRPIPEGGGGA
eukprot:12457243-Alexandrium_andersonii.AAC.1